MKYLLVVSALLTLSAAGHAVFRKTDGLTETLLDCARLTGFATPAFRVSWHESRLPRFGKRPPLPYPELEAADRLDFLYAKDAW